MSDKEKYSFPFEPIDLPSGGKLYADGSPLRDGTIDIKYMTAREEDILTSQNLIKKGIVLDLLMNSLILSKGVHVDDLLVGDKNAVMVAARILAYGSDYTVSLTDYETDEQFEHTFNLADLPYKVLPDDVTYDKNEFEIELPVSKSNIIFKLLNGRDEKSINSELKALEKLGSTSKDITTRLKHSILSVDGESDKSKINDFVDNMLSRDSLFLRNRITKISPDIEFTQIVEFNGTEREVIVPMELGFFWPSS
tara:strand:- start:263 stop:1018 length:756 start_codon:yes stop_codon:yes gene_type:complete